MFFFVTSTALWIDQLLNGAIRPISSHTTLYLALFIASMVVCTLSSSFTHVSISYLSSKDPHTLDNDGRFSSPFSSKPLTDSISRAGLVLRAPRNEETIGRILRRWFCARHMLGNHVLFSRVPLDLRFLGFFRIALVRGVRDGGCQLHHRSHLLEEL